MAEARVVPSDLFPLVLAFLKENRFEGAARAFGKAAGVTEQDPNAASLLDVFNYWLKSPEAKKRKAFPNGPPAKKAKRESSSSSESSSEDEEPPVRKPAVGTKSASAPKAEGKAAAPVKAESSSSEDSSDSSDSEPERKKPAKKGANVQVKKVPSKSKPQKKSSSSSSDSSSSEDDAPKKEPPKPEAVKKAGKPASKPGKVAKGTFSFTNGTAEGSSSSSSSEDSDNGKGTPAKTAPKRAPVSKPEAAQGKNRAGRKQDSSSSSEDSSSSSGDEKPASKLKPGQYSAVPPPLTLERKKGKGPGVACKKIDSSGKKEQLAKKKIAEQPAAKQPAAKQPSRPKSSAVTQKGESSSDSDSDSSSEEEEKKVLNKRSAKPFAAKGVAQPAQKKQASSSSDSSDSDSSEEEVLSKPAVKPAPKKANKASSRASGGEDKRAPSSKTVSKPKAPAPKSSSSDSESSSSDEAQSKPASNLAGRSPGGPKAAGGKPATGASSSSSDSSSDDGDEEPTNKGDRLVKETASRCDRSKKPKASSTRVGRSPSVKPSNAASPTKHHKSSLDEGATNGVGLTTKKRKREDDQVLETPELKKSKVKLKTPHSFPKMKRQSSPFRRVKEEDVEVDARVANNSFDAKKGAAGDWGEKANHALKFTKGKSFRHEKTKKKRGSYCGGTISTQINSVKFESD